MIIDSHCHLTYEPMCLSLEETIKRANQDGIKYLLTISTEDKSFKNILKICSRISFLILGYFFLSSDIISDFNKFNLLFFLTF